MPHKQQIFVAKYTMLQCTTIIPRDVCDIFIIEGIFGAKLWCHPVLSTPDTVIQHSLHDMSNGGDTDP